MINYPSDLRAPLREVVKTQTKTFDLSTPLSGPAYHRKLSTDAPAFYELTFKFRSSAESLRFRGWIENNNIQRGVEFNCPIPVEGEGFADRALTQVVKIVSGDIRSRTDAQNSKYYTYACTVRARAEVTGFDNYWKDIDEGGVDTLENMGVFDVSMNQKGPRIL